MRQLIKNFLTQEECKSFIDLAESNGMEIASITTPSGNKVNKSYRDNDRYIFDDKSLALSFFEKLKPHLEDSDKEWRLKGLNEKFKIYKYSPGQKFAMHTDASFVRNKNEQSFKTIIIYLNEDFEGGETEFFGMETIPPKTGDSIVFLHHLMHCGKKIESGTKYVLRTDIMYEKR